MKEISKKDSRTNEYLHGEASGVYETLGVRTVRRRTETIDMQSPHGCFVLCGEVNRELLKHEQSL
jgi:hypothetical protein